MKLEADFSLRLISSTRLKAAVVLFSLLSISNLSARDENSHSAQLPPEAQAMADAILPEARRFVDLANDAVARTEESSSNTPWIATKKFFGQRIWAGPNGGENKAADYGWVAARALANFTAYTIYLTRAEGIDLERAMTMGLTGATLSALFQVFTPEYVHWISQHGVFKTTAKKASFIESQLKEFSMQWLYIGVFHLISYGLGVTNDLITQNLIMTVLMSWAVEGSWSVLISRYTDLLAESKYKDRPRTAWHVAKGGMFGLALFSSMLMISGLNGDFITKIIYPITALSGLATYAWVIERERTKRLFGFIGSRAAKVKSACSAVFSDLSLRRRRL